MSGPKGKRGRALTDGSQDLKLQYLESHRSVHQVEIQIIQLEGSKRFLAHLLDQGSLVEGGPQLWGNTKPGSCTPALTKAEHPWQRMWHIVSSWGSTTWGTLIYLWYCWVSKMRMGQSKIPSITATIETKKISEAGENRPASFQQIEVTLFFLPLLLGEKTKQSITQRSWQAEAGGAAGVTTKTIALLPIPEATESTVSVPVSMADNGYGLQKKKTSQTKPNLLFLRGWPIPSHPLIHKLLCPDREELIPSSIPWHFPCRDFVSPP